MKTIDPETVTERGSERAARARTRHVSAMVLSLLVAVAAGFGARLKPDRRSEIVEAAIVVGGAIWARVAIAGLESKLVGAVAPRSQHQRVRPSGRAARFARRRSGVTSGPVPLVRWQRAVLLGISDQRSFDRTIEPLLRYGVETTGAGHDCEACRSLLTEPSRPVSLAALAECLRSVDPATSRSISDEEGWR